MASTGPCGRSIRPATPPMDGGADATTRKTDRRGAKRDYGAPAR